MWLAAFSSSRVSKNTVCSGPIRPAPSTSASSPSREAPSSFVHAARSVSAFSSASILTARPPSNSTRRPSDDRAVELERQRRADVPVDPQRIGRRERLLARDVRVVREAVDRRELGRMPDRRPEEADGQVGAGPVEVDRVESPLGQRGRAPLQRLHPLRPGGDGIVLVEPADVGDRLPEPVERLVGLGVGVDDLGPLQRRGGRDAPVRRAAG